MRPAPVVLLCIPSASFSALLTSDRSQGTEPVMSAKMTQSPVPGLVLSVAVRLVRVPTAPNLC